MTANTDGCAEATVQERTRRPHNRADGDGRHPTGDNVYYQAFVRVLDPRAELPPGAPEYESSKGPDVRGRRDHRPYSPQLHGWSGAGRRSPSILGRHGDTITVSIAGAGQVSLEVDGEGPDLLDIMPENGSAWRSSRLDFEFEVRDGDSGIRHDGELVPSTDGDDTQVNGDGDQVHRRRTAHRAFQRADQGERQGCRHRPRSVGSDASDAPGRHHGHRALDAARRPPGRRLRVLGARAATSKRALYEMRITARDRAGNETVTDASDEEDVQDYEFDYRRYRSVRPSDPRRRVGYDQRDEKEVPDRIVHHAGLPGEPLRPGVSPRSSSRSRTIGWWASSTRAA